MENQIEIRSSDTSFLFLHSPLHFANELYFDVFAKKNNKTVAETLNSKKYRSFERTILENYSEFISWGLGEFLFELKKRNDQFYLSLLNPNGDKVFCNFEIRDPKILSSKGLYFFTKSQDIVYIGSCTSTFKSRINQGYGKIHPKNCYIDGQSTNCRINSLIAKSPAEIHFYYCILSKGQQIKKAEKHLITLHRPCWNIQKS